MPPRLFLLLALFGLLLALPTLLVERSLKRLGQAFLGTTFGVLMPLVVFFLSAFAVPDWKGGCAHGWWDCFHLGKLALAPLVLWASLALYLVEVAGPSAPKSPILTLALFLGAFLATGLFGYGLSAETSESARLRRFLVVPLYASVWFGMRWWQAQQRTPARWFGHVLSLLGSVPFWIAGMIWSRHIYTGLPNQAPECFIVTAASRGHRRIVGKRFRVEHHGQLRLANQQLITFWNCEQLWRQISPLTHRWLRRVYNCVGPAVARRITSPWMADIVYVALKPVEWTARCIGGLARLLPRPPKQRVPALWAKPRNQFQIAK